MREEKSSSSCWFISQKAVTTKALQDKPRSPEFPWDVPHGYGDPNDWGRARPKSESKGFWVKSPVGMKGLAPSSATFPGSLEAGLEVEQLGPWVAA